MKKFLRWFNNLMWGRAAPEIVWGLDPDIMPYAKEASDRAIAKANAGEITATTGAICERNVSDGVSSFVISDGEVLPAVPSSYDRDHDAT